MPTIGRLVRTLRERRGLTQGQLATYAEIDRSYISQIENDHVESIGCALLRRLADQLETSTDFLLGITSNPFPPDQSSVPDTELEWQLLDQFRKLKPQQQRVALALVDTLIQHMR